MTIYWLLFGAAALMVLVFPVDGLRGRLGAVQTLAILGFVLAYVMIATLRYEIGSDFYAYVKFVDRARGDTLPEAMAFIDPAFGVVLWISARLGGDVYLVDGICAALMVIGTVRVALTTREPWLVILGAVPYLLIVVGMGYVRQAGAIGVIMIAMTALDRGRAVSIMAQLVLAAGLHSSAGVVWPLFFGVLARRRRILAIALVALGVAFAAVALSQVDRFDKVYIETNYQSSGAMVRILMNLLPSLLLLARWRDFPITGSARLMWLGFALVSVVTFVALLVSPSSTAVDRIALYFSPVQLIVFGTIMDLLRVQRAAVLLVRALMIALAGSVQMVWLVLAVDAPDWVPYHSILQFL